MDAASPYLAVFPRVWGAVLLALHRTVAPMTGREVARRAGVSQPAALAALDHFVEHGLVRSQPAGRAYLYSLNDEHLLVSAVDQVFDVRAELIKQIAAGVIHWEIEPRHISLFGSMARGDGDTKSDIDVLVVRPLLQSASDDSVWRGQLDVFVHQIDVWTGNRAALVELSFEELQKLHRNKGALLQEIRRDGIRAMGENLDKLLLMKPERTLRQAGAR
jgi:predicted nucleotidyltransferase